MSPPLVLTHGCSLSNLPLFVAAGAGMFAAEGIDVDVQPFEDVSATGDALASGAAELGTAAFTQPLIDAVRENPPRLVAGSGLMGIALLARVGIEDTAGLAGGTVGTFATDPLEVLLHDALNAAGVRADEVTIRHFDRIADAVAAWEVGDLDAVTLAEPHATRLRAMGAVVLSDGTEMWGNPFPDTVLVASERLVTEQPDTVRAAIRAMLAAETFIATDLAASVELARVHFPGFSSAELIEAARRQPPCVDLRALTPTVYGRWSSLQSLGLVADGPAPIASVQLGLLEVELAALAEPTHVTSSPREP